MNITIMLWSQEWSRNDAGELQGKFRIWEMYIADTTGKNENRLCSDTWCTQAKCKKGGCLSNWSQKEVFIVRTEYACKL